MMAPGIGSTGFEILPVTSLDPGRAAGAPANNREGKRTTKTCIKLYSSQAYSSRSFFLGTL